MTSQELPRPRVIFWAILGLLLFYRLTLLWRFGFQFTDNDAVVFWLGAKDYARGIFHEPCFYGQNYNYMLESLLAAPFFRLGIPCWYSLPAITSALALAPYIVLAFCFRNRNLPAACAFLAIPLLLPVEFDMLTSISRGFVTGLCFLALFPFIDRIESLRGRFFAAGLVSGCAVSLNPNAAPAVAAMILVMQLRDPRRAAVWICPLLGLAPFLALNYLVAIYYASHPPLHVLSASLLVFHPGLLIEAIKHLDRHFAWLCPLFWTHGSVVLIFLLALVVVLARQRRRAEAVALLAALVIMAAALGTAKIHDGSTLVAYPYSRMFLAAPLLVGIGFSFCSGFIKNPGPALVALGLVCAVATLLKMATLQGCIQHELASSPAPVELRRVADVRSECAVIDAFARKKIELVVALPPLHCSYPDAAFYCMAGEIMFSDYPRTLIYGFDRRGWRSESELPAVTTNILFIGGGRRGWQEFARIHPNVRDVSNGGLELHQMRNTEGLPLRELLRKMKPVMESD